MRVPEIKFVLRGVSLAASLALMLGGAAHAELIFSAPPRETPEAGHRMYDPIAEQLTELLGEPVVYEHPKAWQTYSFEMRRGRYDIVFDGPHFGAWRMIHLDHTPVVTLPGSLVFVVITHSDDSTVETLDDFRERKICGLASPNLGTMTLLAQFPNPVRQPIVVDIPQGGFKAVYNAWKKGECEAAVLRDQFFAKNVPEEEKAKIKVIFTSKPVPNQTITVSPKVSPAQRRLLVDQWTSEAGAVSAKGLFERFSRKSQKFEPADPAQYEDLNLLLEGLLWGW